MFHYILIYPVISSYKHDTDDTIADYCIINNQPILTPALNNQMWLLSQNLQLSAVNKP